MLVYLRQSDQVHLDSQNLIFARLNEGNYEAFTNGGYKNTVSKDKKGS